MKHRNKVDMKINKGMKYSEMSKESPQEKTSARFKHKPYSAFGVSEYLEKIGINVKGER